MKPAKGASAVPEGFAALMGAVPIAETGTTVPPFTLGPDGEPILPGSDDATAEGMADILGLSLTAEEAGDPTALSMEASFTGLMIAALPAFAAATPQETGPVTVATTVNVPAVTVPQAAVQVVAGAPDPQLPLTAAAAAPLAADAVAASATQTPVKVALEASAPAAAPPVEAKGDAKIAAPAPQTALILPSGTAPKIPATDQQPISATTKVQTVAQTQVMTGM